MLFDEVHIVTPTLKTANKDAVANAAKALNVSFPVGYEEFVTRFGKGIFSNWVRVYMPDRIVAEITEFRERWAEFYFWEEDKKTEILESLILADTVEGDELLYHPTLNKFYYLPRGGERTWDPGSTFIEAIQFSRKSGKVMSFNSGLNRSSQTYCGEIVLRTLCEKLSSLPVVSITDISDEDTEDPFFEAFVSEICGSIVVESEDWDETAETEAFVEYDATSDPSAIAKITSILESFDLELN